MLKTFVILITEGKYGPQNWIISEDTRASNEIVMSIIEFGIYWSWQEMSTYRRRGAITVPVVARDFREKCIYLHTHFVLKKSGTRDDSGDLSRASKRNTVPRADLQRWRYNEVERVNDSIIRRESLPHTSQA